MKMRTFNVLTGILCILLSIGCLYSVYLANAPTAVIIIMWVSIACSVWLFARSASSAFFLRKLKFDENETPEPVENTSSTPTLVEEFTVCGKRCAQTKDQILDWLATREGREFAGGQAILANVTDLLDGEGRKAAYGLMFVGTHEGKKQMEREFGEFATILDFWPIDATSWDALFDDDFYEDDEDEEDRRLTELMDKAGYRIVASLKEEKNDASQPDLEGVPSDGN